MEAAGAVDVVEDRGERRRLARAGGAGAQDEPAVLLGEARDALRQAELLEARHVLGDHAEGERDRAALAVAVDSEARELVRRVRDVELAGLVERLELCGRKVGDDRERGLEIGFAERDVVREQAELAVTPQHRRLADFEVEVARAMLHGARQDSVQVHDSADRQVSGNA